MINNKVFNLRGALCVPYTAFPPTDSIFYCRHRFILFFTMRASLGAAGNPLDNMVKIEQSLGFAHGSMAWVHGTGAIR